jgi:hypothetical protein
MKLRSSILGVLFFQCAVFAQFSGNCPRFSDPNYYIDDLYTLENGSFECGDPNLTEYGFTPPIYWGREPSPKTTADCYAEILSSFDPNQNDPHTQAKWNIPAPYEGETFVLLSTGGFGGIEDKNIKGATISQKVMLHEGDVIIGAYFLGTVDYPHYNDYCRIYAQLEPNMIDTYPDPNELVMNGGFDSDASWTITGLWTITDPNTLDPNFVEPNIAAYNVVDPNVDSTLSQAISFVHEATYRVSIDVLTGEFNYGSDAFMVTLGNKKLSMIADANSTITELFTPTSGDTFTIAWNKEGTINIDNVSVRCAEPRPVEEFRIASKSLGSDPNQIPRYGSTEDWVEFEHVIESNQAGPYVLYCEVVDESDAVVSTYLAVDGLRICRGGKALSDLNDDCDVNLIDYSILSEAWLAFCPDPDSPFYNDPNSYDRNDYPPVADSNVIPCLLANLDNSWLEDSWFVDSNDLLIMSDEWLFKGSEPNSL